MDDTHTRIFHVNFEPSEERAADGEETEQAIVYLQPFKNPPQALHPFARFRMDRVDAQDYMAWESQGPIANRLTERLATSDGGIILFRETLKENIEKVQKGLDPLGVIRDPDHEMIDTKLSESLEQMARSGRIRRRNLATG
jgi:5,5'-dehydrodivanillate O-demethylase